ncbi:MAG: RlmE family RNA methyltransferase [Holosporales bacterium]|nr:RlmE family RNA methyltransferase [Holosporales bacterium]
MNNKKKRSSSSRNWLVRQLKDKYVARSRDLGYRSRSAFKLLEIDKKYRIFANNQVVVDLGCAPGGWLQVATKRSTNGIIIGVDLNDITPLQGVTFIKGDFLEPNTTTQILQHLNDKQIDIVLSDMTAPACGINQIDVLRNTMLVNSVINFCDKVNAKSMIAKVLRGGTEKEIFAACETQYQNVLYFKPHSSRQDSSEIYIVATRRTLHAC